MSKYQTPITPKVVLVRCDSYEEKTLDQAMSRGLALLGGAESIFSLDEKVLIKPNVLIGDPPEKNTATHPKVFAALARALQACGASLTYGDSPAFGPPLVSMKTSGLAAEADKLGIPMADFVHSEDVPFPEGQLIKHFPIAKGVREADGVISLAKFKAHALTRITGAVKNLFGCIPGMIKTEFHATLKDSSQFGKMLLDLATLVNPRLCVMDAIIGMEGNGPRNGTPRKVGLLIFATDPTALDAVMARLVVIDPMLVPTLKAAEEKQAGTVANYTLLGDPIEDFILKDFDVNRKTGGTKFKNGLMNQMVQKWVSPRPVIDDDKCIACGTCVDICPVSPKALSFSDDSKSIAPVYDYELCIRCYCCQETCPYEAIFVKTPLLGRMLR
ncbi:MAG: DUF362 domain-containing protein [Anaerolineaceae bacterium]|nr:DUF362 domain-containing protein [Anaerolineaceae bacterium]